jgi:multiple sugar transport system permease protein
MVTVVFTVIMVEFETALGLWMAMIMNRTFRDHELVRAAVLVAWAIPTRSPRSCGTSSSPASPR